MEVCEKCRKPVSTFDYKDKRSPRLSSDINVTVVVSKPICLDCVMEALLKIVSDYTDSGHQLYHPVPKNKLEYQRVATG